MILLGDGLRHFFARLHVSLAVGSVYPAVWTAESSRRQPRVQHLHDVETAQLADQLRLRSQLHKYQHASHKLYICTINLHVILLQYIWQAAFREKKKLQFVFLEKKFVDRLFNAVSKFHGQTFIYCKKNYFCKDLYTFVRGDSMTAMISPTWSRKNSRSATSSHALIRGTQTLSAAALLPSRG